MIEKKIRVVYTLGFKKLTKGEKHYDDTDLHRLQREKEIYSQTTSVSLEVVYTSKPHRICEDHVMGGDVYRSESQKLICKLVSVMIKQSHNYFEVSVLVKAQNFHF